MRRIVILMAVISLAGCANGFLRLGQPDQEQRQAHGDMKEEFQSNKIYRIFEEKGRYYVIRLKTPDTAAVSEKETAKSELPQERVPVSGGHTETKSQDPIGTPDKKTGIKIEIPKGTIPGGASGQQARATIDRVVNSQNVQMTAMNKFSEESQNPSEKDNDKKESRQTAGKVKKEVPGTLRSQFGRAENRPKSLEDHSSQRDRSEITIFFPQDKAFLLKGAPERDRLNAFVGDISRRSAGRKVFLTLIGSASANGNSDYNLRLSKKRAEYVKKVLDGLLVNVPHEYHKVYGLGDSQSPKAEDRETSEKYQNVRIIAVYDVKQLLE